jgi:hypothetical protein
VKAQRAHAAGKRELHGLRGRNDRKDIVKRNRDFRPAAKNSKY